MCKKEIKRRKYVIIKKKIIERIYLKKHKTYNINIFTYIIKIM